MIHEAQDAGRRADVPPVVLEMPERIGAYRQYGDEVPVSDHVKRVLQTSQIYIQNYVSREGWPVQLQLVHAGTTRRSLHFPEVCLVGQGWEIRDQKAVPVGFSFDARQLVLFKGDQYEAVLYWFKTGDRFTGNFFINSWYWTYEQLTFGIPSSTMIKLSTPLGGRDEEAAFDMLESFAQKLAPVLMTRIP
jgi:EpsI family protein